MTKKHGYDFDLIIIGSGAGGSTAAVLAARNKLSVAIIEEDTFGGDAPNHTDVPSAAFLGATHLFDAARRGSRFGISSTALRFNFPSLVNWKNIAVRRTGSAGNRKYYEDSGIKTFSGRAHFLSPNEISVARHRLTAKYFLIASGSVYKDSNIKNLENVKYYTPRTILNLVKLPKTIFIVGAGSTGVEWAECLAELGVKVVLADITSRILPKEDEEVDQVLGKYLSEKYGIKVLTESRVVAVETSSIYKKVTFMRGGASKSIQVDEVLIATGKTPALDLGLENAGIKYTKEGITVSQTLRTNLRHIFAAGDCLGGQSSTTKATLESTLAAENIITGSKQNINYTGLPRLTNTFPAIAAVGFSEDDCSKRAIKFKKSVLPLALAPISNVADFKDGFIKIITDVNGKILGATIVAPEAANLIAEISLAIRAGLYIHHLIDTPHAFLTWSEALRLAALKIK